MKSKLLTVKDVAQILQASPSTIYSWAEQGLIPSFKLNGLLRFDEDEIYSWVKSSRNESAPPICIKPKTFGDDDINSIIKSTIASVKGPGYNPPIKGKPDQSSPGRRE